MEKVYFNLAKVGVEGSNPFARSIILNDIALLKIGFGVQPHGGP